MTEAVPADPRPSEVPPKVPPPGLSARAPRPTAVRLRRSVVQTLVVGGAVLVSGSLVWAFVVQPELRDGARARQIETREAMSQGPVRPAETVTEQPATYDRLPPPRGGEADVPETAAPTVAERQGGEAGPAYPARSGTRTARPAGPTARELAARSGLFFAGQGSGSSGPEVSEPATGSRAQQALQAGVGGPSLVPPVSPYELKAGALVPAALLTAVDTARAGPVIATVTQNVYDSVSGRYLLLPQGTRLIGRSGGDSAYGDRRAFLTWERMILPNGKSLLLDSEAGVDAQGAIGVRGEVDRRLLPLLVATVLSGAVTTLGQIARDDGDQGSGGLLGDAGDAVAIEGARIGGRLVDRELEVRPSIRLRAGAAVRVLITRDLVLEPYRP